MSDRRTGNIRERYSSEEPPRKNARERFAEYQKELKEEKERRYRPPKPSSPSRREAVREETRLAEKKAVSGRAEDAEVQRIPAADSIRSRGAEIFRRIRYRINPYLSRADIRDRIMIIGLGAAVAAAAVIFITILAGSRKIEIRFTGGSTGYSIGEEQFELNQEPYLCEGAVYIPAQAVLAQLGYEVTVDESGGTLTAADKKNISYVYAGSDIISYQGQDYQFQSPAMLHNDILFMPVTMLTQFTEDEIHTDGDFKEVKMPVRDLLETTSITDEYRLTAEAVKYNGIYLIGEDTAMELLAYADDNCANYAAVINAVAEALPEVNVYDIAIPSMSEFYGPGKLYTDQISGIRKIYSALDSAVMPINAVGELWTHAGEKLYFNTDHHWTQRGAYYAYKAFVENKGWEADPIESFETQNDDQFLGSWMAELVGTTAYDVLGAHPELLERFLPKRSYSGAVYDDMRMQKLAADNWQAIKLEDNTYTTFLGGDMPLIHFQTDAANGKSIMVIKESFGNAFAPWLLNNYENVYIVDPRNFNGFGGHNEAFNLRTFYDEVAPFDDLIVISYPNSTTTSLRQAILNLVQ